MTSTRPALGGRFATPARKQAVTALFERARKIYESIAAAATPGS
jgi:hypothetical protein